VGANKVNAERTIKSTLFRRRVGRDRELHQALGLPCSSAPSPDFSNGCGRPNRGDGRDALGREAVFQQFAELGIGEPRWIGQGIVSELADEGSAEFTAESREDQRGRDQVDRFGLRRRRAGLEDFEEFAQLAWALFVGQQWLKRSRMCGRFIVP